MAESTKAEREMRGFLRKLVRQGWRGLASDESVICWQFLGANKACIVCRFGAESMSESLLSLCARIACEAHAGQVDKAGEPYIFHVMRVAMAVEGEEAKAVALLHDVIEDCGWYPIDSGAPLGLPVNVVNALIAITRRKEEGETYATYIERVARDPLARRVKLADLADNLRPERISALPPEQAASLAKRYHAAFARLRSET